MDYHDDLIREFEKLLEAEQIAREVEGEAKQVIADAVARQRTANAAVEIAYKRCATIMQEQGILEDDLPAPGGSKYRLAFSVPRESIADPENMDAVPMSLIRTKRELIKKEAMEFANQLREAGKPLPNWLQVKTGESTLGWKLVKG